MGRWSIFLAAVSILACPVAAHNQSNVSAPSQPPTVSSQGQSGGQTAGTIYNYGPGPRDRQHDALGAVMVRYLGQLSSMLSQYQEGNAYRVLYSESDPFFHVNGHPSKVYVFYAGNSDFIEQFTDEGVASCVFQTDLEMVGIEATVSIGEQISFQSAPLPLENEVFQRVCDSIGRNASQAWGGDARSGQPPADQIVLTNYDVLSRGRQVPIMIEIYPGELMGEPYERRIAREYWSGALQNIDLSNPLRHVVEQQRGRAGAAEVERQTEATGQLAVSLDYAAFLRENSFERVVERARSYFGRAFTDMDSSWVATLSGTTITLGSRSQALLANGRFMTLQRFRLSEIGSARFWTHITDGGDFAIALACVATAFAVDHEYARPSDLPGYADCMTSRRNG